MDLKVVGDPRQPREKITLLAVSFASGIAIGWWQGRPILWPWLVASLLGVAAAALVYRRSGRLALCFLVASTTAFGAAWLVLRLHYVAADDLAAWVGPGPRLVRMVGIAGGPPVRRQHAAGSMARFDYRPLVTYFPLRVRALIGRDGRPVSYRGTVLVRVDDTLGPLCGGDSVEVVGMLLAPNARLNPGEYDYWLHARSHGRAGLLIVASRELVTVRAVSHGGVEAAFVRWRETLKLRAHAWLLADLPATDRMTRDALLAALLLGRRGPELEPLGKIVRRVGLAHFLAISGLHLGVLAGSLLLLLRSRGLRPWHGWLLLGVVAFYLLLVQIRMPILRAGLMTMGAGLALAAGRRLQVTGLVGLSAIILLLWRPAELLSAGFQLSFGVVLALVHLAPIVRRRWFGPPDLLAASSGEMAGQWLRSTAAAAWTAWAVATPITMYHWGVFWPLAALYSILALPLVAVILTAGYLKIILAVVLPSAGKLVGVPLSFAADVLIALLWALDAVPLSVLSVRFPPLVWSVGGLVWVITALGWGLFSGGRGHRLRWLSGAVLAVWLVGPMVTGRSWALRLDMLAVGNGSCFVVRSGGRTVLFDAGSSSDLDVGRKVIVPALRRLGVRSIDAAVISHPNLDHFSGLLEVADELVVRRVLVTEQFMRQARDAPDGPVAWLLDGLTRRFIPVVVVGAGESLAFGQAMFQWLHPDPDEIFGEPNNGSMVIRIEAAGRSVLLCGDIQRQAMAGLLGNGAALAADILELPHHGSHHWQAEVFLRAVGPRVVMVSSGRNRWRRASALWHPWPVETVGLVTARDGACWVEVDREGSIRFGRFLGPPATLPRHSSP